ncbi:MAG: VWA domain-containing protein [Algicola sp.]|nr:VWA domain-containing protein [Algicola sp.]
MKRMPYYLGLIALLTSFTSRSFNLSLEHKSPLPKETTTFIKVALLLDTSNSMDGLIDQAKAQLWRIVNRLSYVKCHDEHPRLQIALYEYGNDNLSKEKGYLRQVLAFSEDLDDISEQLFSLTTNGGNEYCGAAIQGSLNDLDWGISSSNLNLIFIAGNESFNQGAVAYQDAAINAIEKGITINTIFCGDYAQGIQLHWEDAAKLTQGNYLAINHNKETVHIATPYDNEILDQNKQLNNTYMPYGHRGTEKLNRQQEQDQNAYNHSKANAVSRALSKSSHAYKNTSWDLVDAVMEHKINLNDISWENLPKQLQNMSKKELSRYITKQYNKRLNIQDNIKTLNLKRQDYLTTHTIESHNPLEKAMLSAIKEQAKKRHCNWE